METYNESRMLSPQASAELRSAWTGEGARPHTGTRAKADAASRVSTERLFWLLLRTDN